MTTAQDGGKVVSLRHRPPLPQEIHLVLISIRDWVDPKVIVRPEWLCHWKILMTPLGYLRENNNKIKQYDNECIQGDPRVKITISENVPYVKIYRYNPKHLYPKLNSYGDNGKRSLKVWQLLHTYWLPNSYWNWQEYVVPVMSISVLNFKVTCEWHKAIKLNYKNIRTRVIVILRVRSTIHYTVMSNANVTWLTAHSVTWHPTQGRT